jgi:hypothetical protein
MMILDNAHNFNSTCQNVTVHCNMVWYPLRNVGDSNEGHENTDFKFYFLLSKKIGKMYFRYMTKTECKILGAHCSDYDEYCLFGCDIK